MHFKKERLKEGIMGLLSAIVKTVAIVSAEKLGSNAIESIAKHSEEKLTARYIYVPESSDYFYRKNYEEAKEILIAHGFENLHLFEKKDLKNNFFQKGDNHKVIEVSIDGKTSFKKKERFLENVRVVITYHGFKK